MTTPTYILNQYSILFLLTIHVFLPNILEFQIPMCLILPTEDQPTAKNRDIPPCHITFPKDADCGIPPKDVPISVIFNGFYHYVGTRPKKPSFKDGLDDIIEGLNNCMAISSDLIRSTDNHAIKHLLNLFNATNKENIYTMTKLFDFSDTSIDGTPKPKERTRRGTSSFKPNQCPYVLSRRVLKIYYLTFKGGIAKTIGIVVLGGARVKRVANPKKHRNYISKHYI